MKIKTSELTGPALDYWVTQLAYEHGAIYEDGFVFVATCEGNRNTRSNPSTNWSQGGPIIERHWEELCTQMDARDNYGTPLWMKVHGDELLQFWMRCFVASKLGNEVDVPEELT